MNLSNFYTILCLLIMFNCHAIGSIEMVEDDNTTEEEDMVKALALSKTYFWRNMVENWYCSEDTLKVDRIEFVELGSMGNLIKFCENWKMMAWTADAYGTNWAELQQQNKENSTKSLAHEKHKFIKKIIGRPFSKKNASEKSTESLTVVKPMIKPIFLYNEKKLHLSSAMAAFVLIGQALLLERGNRNYLKEIKINFVNKNKCNVVEQEQPKNGTFFDLNKLGYIGEPGAKNYRELLGRTVKLMEDQWLSDFSVEDLIQPENTIKADKAQNIYEKLWVLTLEIGIDMNVICAGAESITEIQNDTNITQKDKEAPEILEKISDNVFKLKTNEDFEIAGLKLGQIFELYRLKDKDLVEKAYSKDIKERTLRDPCEEAKLRVKTKGGQK